MKFTFTFGEVKEILLSAIVLSVAFAMAYSQGILGALRNLNNFPFLAVIAFIAVGIGFLSHELIGHKLVAQKLDMHAQYHMWRMGLVIAFLSSLVGFVFAAPGAVYFSARMDLWGGQTPVSKKKIGLVSVFGPLINLVLVGVFFALSIVYQLTISGYRVFEIATWINLWLAIFNMLPIPPLDGSKVFAWDKRIWVVVFAVLIVMFFLSGMVLHF